MSGMDGVAMDKIIDDLVENRRVFDDMKNDVLFIIKENDNGNDFHLTYDEFCIKCLDNIKKKKIDFNTTVKTVKQHFLEAMVQIAIDELVNRGRIEESEKVKTFLHAKD